MKRTISLLLLILTAVAALTAQSRSPKADGTPNNSWGPSAGRVDGLALHPDDIQGVEGCLIVYHQDGNVFTPVPVVGQGITISTYTTTASGWHSHEPLGVISPRPQAWFTEPVTQLTGTNGCARWTAHFPGWAGWYTFEVFAQGFPTKGLNFYVYEYEYTSGRVATSQVVRFVNYPDNQQINIAQSASYDPNHNGFSHYMTPTTKTRITTASGDYINASFEQFGTWQRADMYRASLPDGGVADNQSYFAGTANWSTQIWEEHALGDEVDIINPSVSPDPNVNTTMVYVMMTAMRHQGCVVGAYRPNGVNPETNPANYWASQSFVHFTCDAIPRGINR